MEFLLFFFFGILVSVFSGFFGIGGGFILTPFLMLIGYTPLEAITTSLLFTIGSSLSGVTAHLRLKNIQWKEGLILGLSGVAATQAAKPFVLFLERRGFDEWAIPVLYIVLLVYFTLKIFKDKSDEKLDINKSGIKSLYGKLIIIGFFAGFVSTTLGVGGGFIIVPLTVAFLGFEARRAVGTSLMAVLMIVTAGFISYSFSVSIDYRVGLLLVAGGLIGSPFGAKLTKVFLNKEIKWMIGLLYLSTLGSVVMKLFGFNIAGLIITAAFIITFFVIAILKTRGKKKRLEQV